MSAGRVLIVSENAPVPSDRRVMNIGRGLVRAGWDVSVACAAGDGREDAPHEEIDGISVHRFPLRPAGGAAGYAREYAQALLRIRRLARELASDHPFDIVHACNPPDVLLAAVRGLRRQGTRFVFDHHDLVPELYRSRFGRGEDLGHRATIAMERLAFRMADVSLATNGSYARIAVERGGMDPDDVFVVRNGPDLTRFRPVVPDPAIKRGRPYLIGYLGIMGPQDGVDHAVTALGHLAGRDDWHAVFLGTGESLEAVRALGDRLGIADRLEFRGWCGDDEIRAVLSTCDVCLAPDPPSPLNDVSTMIKIPEYMAMGAPIASYDLPESRVSAGDAAAYAAPGDAEDLARAVAALLDDPDRRARMARIALDDVRDRLAWQHQEGPLLRAYERALGAGPERSRAARRASAVAA